MASTQGTSAIARAPHARCRGFVVSTGTCLLVLAAGTARLVADESTADSTPPATSEPLRLSAVGLIDAQLRGGWAAHGISPSAPATDGQWCRRAYLDVVGRIPTVAELEQYQREPGKVRRQRLVERLLGAEYAEDYARHWTNLWTNLLIGRSGGTQRNSLTSREGLRQALSRALARNMPYDQLAFELVAARGVSQPGAEGFNGFVNFLADNLQDGAVQATAKTSQVFLGVQIQCTQCHNHPFNDWKQSQFWEFNSFFRQARALRRFDPQGDRRVSSIELINQDFAGENDDPDEALVFYEQRNGLSKVAGPVFLSGEKPASNSGLVAVVDRRTALAGLIVGSDYLSRACVNRIWAHFFGYGLAQPVDDMGPHNPPSHPELLDGLAASFRASHYDVKQLMSWLLLSEAYGLSSRPGGRNKHDDPSRGERPLFSRFYLRQMRAEELYESLLVATEADQTERGSAEQQAAQGRWLEQFTLTFGTDDNAEATTFNGTIPQILMMMNGDLTDRATSDKPGSFLARVATDPQLNNAQRITRLYLSALARHPTGQEIAVANERLLAHRGDAVAALQDIWWAVLNSGEFVLNH